MITVLIADDQPLVRAGLRMILSATDDLSVVGEAEDGVAALELADSLRPDVVLMDLQMPRLGGIDATRRLLARNGPRPRVVVLTTFSQSEVVYDALVAGASGFMLKDMPAVQLVGGIRAIARGEELLAPEITRRLIEQFAGKRSQPPGIARLTDRELEVFRLVGKGLSNAEVAAQLVVGVETVKTHVSRILDKLDLRDRVQAVVLAYETGVIRAGTDPQ